MSFYIKSRVDTMRLSLLSGCAVLACAWSLDAKAEEANENIDSGAIIVTARRAEERLQDVPISISVFSQQDLTKRNVAIATDLATYTPSLSVNQRYGPEKSSFAIRGFNQTVNTAPTVGMYFAEVVGVRAQGGTTAGNTVGAGAFTDLANVQVLRGPQGTLFGRNTTGGAILLTPQKPKDEFGGYAEATYGNYDQVRLSGALNLPLAETFRVRLTAERNSRDGYMKNHVPGRTKDFNDINYFYGRFSMVGDLTPDLENYTIFHYSRSRTNGYASHINTCIKNVADGGTLVTIPGTPGYNGSTLLQTLACREQLARQAARGDSPYDVENGLLNPYEHLQQWQVINTTTWQASDTLTMKNIISYGEIRERLNLSYLTNNFTVPNYNGEGGFNLTKYLNAAIKNADGSDRIVPAGTPFSLFVTDGSGRGSYSAAESTVTEELQLQGRSGDGRFNYVLGGYLEFSRPQGFSTNISSNFAACTSVEALECTNPLTFASFSHSRTKMSFDNHGVYGQGTFNFSDQLSLTVGGRWTFDKIVGAGQATRFALSSAAGSYIDPRTGVSLRRTCTDTVTYPGKVVQDPSECTTIRVNKSNKPTWVIDLDYKPIPDLMLYGKWSRGYRQGGINFNSVGFESWGPESMDTYEVGAKASFRGGVSGYLNVSGFYNNLSDLQVLAQLIPTQAAQLAGISGASAILNAGKARSYGVEFDGSLLFFDSLRISLGYAYLNTKIVKIDSAAELAGKLVGTPFGTVIPQVAAGTGFLDTPKHKLTVDVNYTLPLDESLGELSAGATWTHTSRVVTNFGDPQFINGFPVGITPANDLINLNLDWKEVGGSPIGLSLFVTNLTKELVKIPNQFPFAFSGGAVHVGYMAPRLYGIRLKYDFGS
ncbi:MAG TPA: TonB-dependent receptor [Novosphingobium sp.]|nr:TonB-dependent receptor [Novosphingobium sp.]